MIPLYKPYMPPLPNINEILYSGSLGYGKYTKKFEAKLSNYFQHEYLIVTNSFNTAISIVITSLGIKAGDEVIASPMACLASTQPYVSGGLKIIWADIDNKTGTLLPDSVRERITSKTKAIIHNHYCGYPGYIDEINSIGRENGIQVIDDGIECFGSEYKGKKIGNCGSDITVFSFTAVRIPNTVDGGVAIFNNKELYEKSLLIRDCGIDRRIFRDEIGEINPNCDIDNIGYSATMSNLNGYIGCCQMEIVDSLIEKQRENAIRLTKKYTGQGDCIPIYRNDIRPNYWVFGVLADNKRTKIVEWRKKGYYASGVHINNNIYSVFGKYERLPGVEDFYNHFVALPCGWWINNGI